MRKSVKKLTIGLLTLAMLVTLFSTVAFAGPQEEKADALENLPTIKGLQFINKAQELLTAGGALTEHPEDQTREWVYSTDASLDELPEGPGRKEIIEAAEWSTDVPEGIDARYIGEDESGRPVPMDVIYTIHYAVRVTKTKGPEEGKVEYKYFDGEELYEKESPAIGPYAVTMLPKPVTVKAIAAKKVVGEKDPELTFSLWDEDGSGLNPELLTGKLARKAGEDVGKYEIWLGSVNEAENPNYKITYEGADFTIEAATPKTGDSNNMVLWIVLAVIAAGTMTVVLKTRKEN